MIPDDASRLTLQTLTRYTVTEGDVYFAADVERLVAQLQDRVGDVPGWQQVLKKLVIAWDADQDLEFDEAIDEARALIGFKLAPPERP